MKKLAPGILRLAAWTISLFARICDCCFRGRFYHVVKKIPIPGNGDWDYVAADSDARRLYVSHDTEIIVPRSR